MVGDASLLRGIWGYPGHGGGHVGAKHRRARWLGFPRRHGGRCFAPTRNLGVSGAWRGSCRGEASPRTVVGVPPTPWWAKHRPYGHGDIRGMAGHGGGHVGAKHRRARWLGFPRRHGGRCFAPTRNLGEPGSSPFSDAPTPWWAKHRPRALLFPRPIIYKALGIGGNLAHRLNIAA